MHPGRGVAPQTGAASGSIHVVMDHDPESIVVDQLLAGEPACHAGQLCGRDGRHVEGSEL
jgi:hypothetical protein